MATQPGADTTERESAGGEAVPIQSGVQVLPDAEDTPEDYVPDGFESVDEFLADALEQYHYDREADGDNIAAAIDDRYFFGLDQWDEEVRQYRDGLPCLTIDSLGPQVAQVVGDWRINKTAIKVLPREDGDVEVAQIRSDLIRNIEVQSRATRVYTAAFTDQVVCGIGAMKVCLDYTSDEVFEQDVVIKRIADPLAVTWDRMSVDPTGRDSARVFLEDALPRKVYEDRWPDKPVAELGAYNSSYGTTGRTDYSRTDDWIRTDTVRVAEYWRMITRKRTIAMFRDGSVKDITGQPVNVLNLWIDPITGRPRIREVDKRYAQMHLITAQNILEGPYELPIDRVPIIKVTGNEIRVGEKAIRWGIIRPAKDGQRLKNFWRSVEAEQLGYQVNQPWIAEDAAVEGYEHDYEQQHLNRTRLLKYRAGTMRPERVPPPTPQAALITAAQQNAQDIKDATGIHNAMLGIQSNETSGKAIMARQREGDVSTYLYPDNMNESVQEVGSVVNQLIDIAYDAPRTIRIVGDDDEPKLQRINDPSDPNAVNLATGKYDVVISTGPSYTTRRQEAFEMITEIVRGDKSLMRVFGDLLFKAMDAPMSEELAERMRKIIPPEIISDEEDGPEIPPQVQAQMQQMMQALQQMQAENEALKADKDAEMRKADADGYKAETDRLKALVDAMSDPVASQVMWPIIRKGLFDIGMSPDVLPVEPPMPVQPVASGPEPSEGYSAPPMPREVPMPAPNQLQPF